MTTSCEQKIAVRSACPWTRTKSFALLVDKKFEQFVFAVIRWAGGETLSPIRVLCTLLVSLTALILAGIVAALLIPGLKIGWMMGEGDIITIISGLNLLVCAVLARVLWRQSESGYNGSSTPELRSFWKFFTYGFIFLALDEWFRIHEATDNQLHNLAGVKPSSMTDHLDDLIIMLYGITAMVVVIRNLRLLRPYYRTMWFFLGIAVCGVTDVSLDILASAKWLWLKVWTDPNHVQWTIAILDVLEESAEIYAEIFLIATLVACLHVAGVTTALRAPNAHTS